MHTERRALTPIEVEEIKKDIDFAFSSAVYKLKPEAEIEAGLLIDRLAMGGDEFFGYGLILIFPKEKEVLHIEAQNLYDTLLTGARGHLISSIEPFKTKPPTVSLDSEGKYIVTLQFKLKLHPKILEEYLKEIQIENEQQEFQETGVSKREYVPEHHPETEYELAFNSQKKPSFFDELDKEHALRQNQKALEPKSKGEYDYMFGEPQELEENDFDTEEIEKITASLLINLEKSLIKQNNISAAKKVRNILNK